MPQRYFIKLCYDGTPFHGWQIQETANTVQAEMNKALSRLTGEQINTIGCGRTDTGVHAREFFAHIDCEITIEHLDDAAFRLNGMLPREIAIQAIFPVHEKMHARFGASSRTYEYHMVLHKDPFSQKRAMYLRKPVNIGAINEAIKFLFVYEDFSCFSKSRTQTKTNLCTITQARWEQTKSGYVFHISANRFLRNMVRAIMGTLLEIGNEKYPASYMKEVIESKDRKMAGVSVPAYGLYLTKVEYPKLADLDG